MGILDMLEVPLRTTKKAISGDEEEWFSPAENPSKLDHHLYAAGNTALDIVGDPLNFVPFGALAGKGKQAAGAISSAGNYIKNWYGPEGPAGPVIEGIADAASKVLPGSVEDITGGLQTAEGFGSHLLDSLKSAGQHLIDPKSRALWNEQGVTVPQQKRVKELWDTQDEVSGVVNDRGMSTKVDSKRRPKAVANMLYQRHIGEQADLIPSDPRRAWDGFDEKTLTGSKMGTEPSKPYDGTYFLNGPNELADELGYFSIADSAGGVHGLNASEASTLADMIQSGQNMKSGTKITMKMPQSFESGGHFNDVVYGNPAKAAITQVFKDSIRADGTVPIDELVDGLKRLDSDPKFAGKQKGKRKEHWTVAGADDTGVYIKGSKVGSAITEGGVQWVGKVDTDGTLKIMMADTHDFFENTLKAVQAPATALGGKSILPSDVVAVTPPMITNIKNLQAGKKLKAPKRDAMGNTVFQPPKMLKSGKPSKVRKPEEAVYEAPQFTNIKPPSDSMTWDQIVRNYTEAAPTQAGVRQAKRDMALQAAGGAGLLANLLRVQDDED